MCNYRRSLIATSVGLVLLAAASTRVTAQSGVVGGTVYRDTADHPLNSVQVTVVGANRQTVTNDAGDFRITGLSAGRYTLLFRRLGFAPLVDVVTVTDQTPVDREYVMAEQPVALDSVRVTAAEPRHGSSRYNEFLDRLKDHNGGYFINDSVLTKNENRKLQDVLTSFVPGVHLYRKSSSSTAEYLSSGRGACNGPAFVCGGGNSPCPVALYIDGVLYYSPGAAGTSAAPDFNTFNTNDYAGIEYYADGATVPERYNATSNNCGVLLLWTKEQLPPTS